MKITLSILIFSFTLLCFSQKTGVIAFEYKHSKRIPYNSIKITINGMVKGDVKLKVVCLPSDNSEEWKYSKVDKQVEITKQQFDELANTILEISPKDIYSTLHIMYLDGYSSEISFRGFNNQIIYRMNSPSKKGSNGYVPHYRESCTLILRLAGFSEKEIDLIL